MALTPKRKRFCEFYVASLNAKQAAVEVGYSNKSGGASVTATRIMKDPEVKEYIAVLQAEIAERNNVTPDEVIKNLRDTITQGRVDKQHGPVVRATELLGKTVGMFKDHVVLTELQETSDSDLIDKMTKGDEKKAAALRELLGAAEGFDTPETRH